MDDKNKDTLNGTEAEQQIRETKPILEPGEKIFTLALFGIGLIAFGLALNLWLQMDTPRIASAGALPLFVTSLWVILSFLAIIENRKLTSPLSNLKGWKEKARKGLQYAFPLQVVVMLGAIFAYCAALYFGLSFYIVTPLFLYGSMCYLAKKGFLMNIIWTAIVMVFIILVFRMLFGVVFP
ncbi:hypothetical protein OBV_35450 [Oscillibacter valericigenes Sjm18-20]|nr:hypothetical protein OBV_35450 [Oscillibacter valericigenes Sjm18-20]